MQLREMYCQRMTMLRRGPRGEPIIYTFFLEPRPCTKHTIWVLVQMADEFFPLLRELGFLGVSTTVYIFDGAVFDSLYRRCRQRHKAFYAAIENERERTRLENMDHTMGMLLLA